MAPTAKLPIPVKLICADPESEDTGPPALVGRAMAAELPIEYEAIPKTTHFLQVERPRGMHPGNGSISCRAWISNRCLKVVLV